MAVLAVITAFASCKKSGPDPDDNKIIIITPDVPEEVLPANVYNEITKYMNIYEGDTPPHLDGQFVSSPHMLIHASYDPAEDSTLYYDRYMAFTYSEKNGFDFYGKQWDDSLVDSQDNYYAGYYEEHASDLKITGTGMNFSCYYITEGYPDGMYAKQSTIFSGSWDESVGIKNFQVAVVLLETSGNPNLSPEGSFRVLGDADGLAENNNWMGKASVSSSCSNNAFNMFRKK